jgi:predicted dinucleotide-binding enzyme
MAAAEGADVVLLAVFAKEASGVIRANASASTATAMQ